MKTIQFILIVIASTFLSGCNTTELASRLGDFNSSTASIVSVTQSSYKRVDAVHQDMLESQDALKYTLNSNSASGRPEAETGSFFHSNDLKVRDEVLQGLALYASDLNALAGNQAISDYDAQAKSLGEKLKSLDADAVKLKIAKSPLSGTDLAILTTAVSALGEWLIEEERDKAIRKTVIRMKGPVTEITTLLSKEIGGTNKEGLRGVMDEDYIQMAENRGQLLARYQKNNPTAYREIDKTYQDVQSLQKQRASDDDTLEQTATALRQIATTHAALANAADKNNEGVDQLISDLKDQATHLVSVYNDSK